MSERHTSRSGIGVDSRRRRGGVRGGGVRGGGPRSASMAAPAVADDAGGGAGGDFETWLDERLDSLEIDRDVYGAYLLGVLQEVDCDDEEKTETLQGILSAFLVREIKHDRRPTPPHPKPINSSTLSHTY